MALDRRLERAVSETLDLAIDGKREIAAILRGADRLHVLDHVSELMLDDAAAAAPAAERFLVGELETFLTCVVHAGEADEMRRDLSGRIVTPVFALLVDAGEPKFRDGLGALRRQLALEIDEVAALLGEPAVELAARHAKLRGELAALGASQIDIARNRPDRLHRRRNRKRLAMPVEDAPARRRHFQHARIARIALLLQKVGLDGLKIERARAKQPERAREGREHNARAPRRQAHETLRRSPDRAGHCPGSRGTSRTRRVSGERSRSVPTAMRC